MIKLEIRVFEHGPAGLKVLCQGTGVAKTEGEQLYFEVLQGALATGIKVAAEKYAALNLQAAVVEEAEAAALAPLSSDAVELPINLKAAPPSPPQFSAFAKQLLEELQALAGGGAALEIARVRVDEFARQVNQYGRYAAEQLRKGGGKN